MPPDKCLPLSPPLARMASVLAADLDARIDEWSRWCRSARRRPRRRTGSLEGQWRSPQCWHPVGPRPPEINSDRVWQTERAVLALGNPHTMVLVMFYVRLAPPGLIVRRLRLRRAVNADGILRDARLLLAHRLQESAPARRYEAPSYQHLAAADASI